MRYALAIAVVAVAWSAALYLHQRRETEYVFANHAPCGTPGQPCTKKVHPSWEDPVAVLLALGGLAVAVGIGATGRPNFAKPS